MVTIMTIKEAALRLQLIDGVTGKAGTISRALQSLEARISKFDRAIQQTRGALFNAVGMAAAAGAALVIPVRRAMELEDAMADIAKVSNFEGEGLAKLRNDIVDLSKQIPMSASEIAGLAAELSAAGTADSELLRMTALVARVGVAYGMTGAEAGENLGKIRAALGLTIEETERYADAINALSDGTASKASDLTDFSRRVGSLGKMYGYTNEQVLAYGSAMISSGATAETAATGFQAVGRALVKGAAASKPQQQALKRLGLTSKQVAKGMAQDADSTTKMVFDRIRSLPAHERAGIMNQLFGDEAKTATALIENTNLLSKSFEILADKAGVSGSVMREFQNRINTTSGRLAMLRNKALAAAIAYGNALLPSIVQAADALGPFIERIGKFIEENSELVKNVTVATGALLGLRVALLAGKLGFLLIGREMLGAAKYAVMFAGAVSKIPMAIAAAALASGRRALLGFTAAAMVVGRVGAAGVAIKAIGVAALGLLNPLKLAGVAVRAFGYVVKGTLISTGIGAAVVAIGLALNFLYQNFEGLTEMVRGFGDGLKSVAPAITPLVDGIGSLVGWLGMLSGPLDASMSEWRSWGVAAGQAVGDVVAAVIGLPGQIASGISAMYTAGVQMIQSMWDGAVSAFNGMLSWFKELPSRIISAIGSVDLSGLIKWPSMPSWLGGKATAVAAPSAPAAVQVDGARASGGPVRAGHLYAVGERGPELFAPKQDGHIIANHDMPQALGGSALAPQPIKANEPATVSAPSITLHAPISFTINAQGGADDRALAQKIQAEVQKVIGQLDKQLSRSAQVAFSNIKYADA